MAGFECPGCRAVSHNPRDREELYCGRCCTFWTRLSPGVWADETRGELHLHLLELLADNGFADTPENRDLLERAAIDVFGRLGIKVEAPRAEKPC
jgi:hypothetical protein